MKEQSAYKPLGGSDSTERAMLGTGMAALGFVLEGGQEPGTGAANRFPAPENIANILQSVPVDMKAIGGTAAVITCVIGIQAYIDTQYPGHIETRLRFLKNRAVQAGAWILAGTVNYMGFSEMPYSVAIPVGTVYCAAGLYGALYRQPRS